MTLPERRITSAPRIRQVYWCSYPGDAIKPEFSKKRPVVVLSRKSKLHGVVTVVPVTTKPQTSDRHAVKIVSPFDNRDAWVVCNHVTTVAVRRLETRRSVAHLVSREDFAKIVEKVFAHLPDRRPQNT